MADLKGVLQELEQRKEEVLGEVRRIDRAIDVLRRLDGARKASRTIARRARRPRRRMSAEARRRIAEAQRRRWAKVRAGKK